MVQAQARELLNQKESAGRPLTAATRRLAQALDRLEEGVRQAKVAHTNGGGHGEAERVQRENEELRREREALSEAMAKLQSRYDDLHLIADTVYVKLDASIKRLTRVIEG